MNGERLVMGSKYKVHSTEERGTNFERKLKVKIRVCQSAVCSYAQWEETKW